MDRCDHVRAGARPAAEPRAGGACRNRPRAAKHLHVAHRLRAGIDLRVGLVRGGPCTLRSPLHVAPR